MNVERETVNCLDIFTQGSDQATVFSVHFVCVSMED